MDPATDLGAIELVAVVGAVAAILALVSFHVFLSIVKAILGHVWLVGSHIAGAIDHWTVDAMRALGRFLDGQLHALSEVLWVTTVGWWLILWHVVTSIVDAKGWAVAAYGRAVQAEQNAVAYAGNVLGVAESDIANVASSVTSNLAGEIDQAVTAAAAASAAVAAIEAHLPDVVASEAAALFGQAEAFTVAQVQAAEALAGALAGQVSSEAVRLFGQAETDIGVLGGQVVSEATRVLGEAGAHADAVAQAAAAAAAAGVLAQVLPQVAAITAEMDQCVTPLCDTVTPNAKGLGDLGGLLKWLEQAGILAAVLALLVAAVEDPEGSAQGIVQDFGWVDTLGLDIVNVVFGAAGVVF